MTDDLRPHLPSNLSKIVYVKRSMNRARKAKTLSTMMRALGYPTNHESHSSLQNQVYDNEIVVHDLEAGSRKTIYKPDDNSFVGHLDLHWDGQRLLFAKSSTGNWQIWEINIDGTGLRQVSNTPEDVDCYEPIYLPDGRVIVASNAPFQCVPCWYGIQKKFVANLYIMNSDGSGMRRLCFDQDHDSNPSVRNDGRVVFSRWDYTGMNRLFNRPLIGMNPDGTGQRAVYGSNSWFPNALFAPRELPGTAGKFVALLSGYHGSHKSGHLVVVDTNKGTREDEGIVQRISGQGLPLEVKYVDRMTERDFPKFFTPFPITEKKILVTARMNNDSDAFGIYLADTSDDVQLLHKEPGYALFEPIPVMKRRLPPAIPDKVDSTRKDATVFIQDVHVGPGLHGVPRGTIKDLRIIAYNFGYIGLAGNDKIGLSGPWEPVQILGMTPVEKDGSASFKVPANTPIAFQALDSEGKAVQLMRTWFTAMPGEAVSCVGCHESPKDAPLRRRTIAATGAPHDLTPWYGPARGFDFEREVQPVLNKHCVSCHDGSKKDRPDLRAEDKRPDYKGLAPGRLDSQRMSIQHKRQYGGNVRYTPAYEALLPYIRRVNVGDDVSLLNPGHYHADTSELIQMLQQRHGKVEIDREGWDRLITWVDLNGQCHGTWADVFRMPVLNGQDQRRAELARLYGEAVYDPEAVYAVADYKGKGKSVPTRDRQDQKELFHPDYDAKLEFRDVKVEDSEIRMVKVLGKDEFWMSVCEISNEQFRMFDQSHDSWFYTKRHATRGDDRGISLNGPDQPALRVSWDQANAFCEWLSGKTGSKAVLPTEDQWERACSDEVPGDFSIRANVADKTFATFGYKGRTTYFQIGGDVDYIAAEGVALADSRHDDKHCVTAPIGTYNANKYGLKDMYGNAAEWTSTEQDGEMIVKGGSYLDRPERCKREKRVSYPAWQKPYNVGFRIVVQEISLAVDNNRVRSGVRP
jgi:formylglycine-generating enzyme required for sulfatase activity